MLARINSADEHSPWAIITITAPAMPHDVRLMVPAIMIPMWPTDE